MTCQESNSLTFCRRYSPNALCATLWKFLSIMLDISLASFPTMSTKNSEMLKFSSQKCSKVLIKTTKESFKNSFGHSILSALRVPTSKQRNKTRRNSSQKLVEWFISTLTMAAATKQNKRTLPARIPRHSLFTFEGRCQKIIFRRLFHLNKFSSSASASQWTEKNSGTNKSGGRINSLHVQQTLSITKLSHSERSNYAKVFNFLGKFRAKQRSKASQLHKCHKSPPGWLLLWQNHEQPVRFHCDS